MQKLLDFLLGIKPAPWTEGGQRHLEWLAWPRHDLALLLFIAVGLSVWGVMHLYKREGRNLGLPARVMLATLRMLVLAGVLAMLLEPVAVFRKTEWVPSHLLVLVDDSGSMDLRDAYADARYGGAVADALKLKDVKDLRAHSRLWLARHALEAGLLKKLESNGDRILRHHRFAAQLAADAPSSTSQPSSQPATPDAPAPRDADRDSTSLGTSIRQLISNYRGQPLAGVLVLTDGQSNTGEPPFKAAEFAGSEGVPIVSIAAGTPEGPRTVTVKNLEVSPVVFVRDPNSLRVLVESRGMQKLTATVVLERSREGGVWEEAGRQPITLGEAGQVQTIPFEFREDKPTKLRMRARLEDIGPEVTVDEQALPAEVRVIRQKIRVLFIAGSTFPEVEFIRNALLRDRGVSASTWLQTADAQYDQFGNPPIKKLPVTQEELNDYDCVVLYDPDPNLWPSQFGQMLTDFVAKAGGGLVYVAGERMTKDLFERQEDPSLGWISLLPVVVDPGLYHSEVSMKLSAREAWKLEITPEGRADSIFQFADKPEQNETVLANLPGMYWHFPVTRAKPGATILARHADPRMRNEHGQHVLLATQLVGPGRTFFVGFDSTYRWRYLDEQYFDGFWARMIDRAGRSKQLGGRYPYTLSTDRPSYRPGSQVTLTARFENAADRDAGLDSLHGELAVGDQPPMAFNLTPRKGESGVFEQIFPVSTVGPHEVRVWTGEQEAKGVARAATLQFKVEVPSLETERPGTDVSTLQQMARASGGAVFDLSQLDKVPSAFKTTRVARTLEDRQELWNAPLLYGSILLALFAEWLLRKKYRLV